MSYELALKERYAEARGRLGMPLAGKPTARRFAPATKRLSAPVVAPAPDRPLSFVSTCFDATDEYYEQPKMAGTWTAPYKAIMLETASRYKTRPSDLASHRRDANTVFARHEAAYRMRNELSMTWRQIANRLGLKDHTSALHAYRAHERFLRTGERSNKWRNSPKGSFWTTAKIQEAVYLRSKGLTMIQVSDAIGAASAEAVSSRLQRYAEEQAKKRSGLVK